MSYEAFAYYYDSLMDQDFYNDYIQFINEHVEDYQTVLELGCGTGEIAIRLAHLGKQVCATDISKDMLEVAKYKCIDFKADAGTSVGAAYAGTVESITDTLLEGGKVVIDHGNGLKSEYASIDVVAGLQVGDSVAQGEVIGTVSAAADVMGNEYNEGAHLHFEVTQDGKSIDPSSYLDLDEK